MSRYMLYLNEVDRTQLAMVGGKGAHLGELSRIDGICVPAGICVSTDAFRRAVVDTPAIDQLLAQLSLLGPDDQEATRRLNAEIRRAVEGVVISEDLADAVTAALAPFGLQAAYAVRSSATAEDLPTASFAGQHDTYLNVVGPAAVLRHVSRCWASLFTDRAVAYRQHNGIDHRHVHMAVVVQQMAFPEAAGVLFTADPVNGNRKVASVEASFGLGDALVSGLVNADEFKVGNGEVLTRTVRAKQVMVEAVPTGGTEEQSIAPDRQQQPALTDAQAVRLVELGRRVEAHFGHPQDIEWCLVDGDFQVVQSRPITTLFPVPDVDDGENHVYVSVGHQQMMTDPIKPLGLSVWQLTAGRPMDEAAGRLFVDVTHGLAAPASRAALLDALGSSDPLIGDALQTIVDRDDFLPSVPDGTPAAVPAGSAPAPIATDPTIVAALIARNEASIAASKREIETRTGDALFDFILADTAELKRLLFAPDSLQVINAGMEAAAWLNEHLQAWLGEKNAADVLTQSAPDNVTSEMGLALLDVADAIRPHADVVAFLQGVDTGDDTTDDADGDVFFDELEKLPGGPQTCAAIQAWLDNYGMRCVGEIDITRPRWAERPVSLVPVLLGNIRHFEPGEARRRFEKGRQEASDSEQELLERLRALPDGVRKADEAREMTERLRTFIGYREHPKYTMVSRYFIYKQALLHEAEQLVRAQVLQSTDDIFYLTFSELRSVARTHRSDSQLIRRRRHEFMSYRALTPPRVLTSDGEVVLGVYRRDDMPAGALVGLPVSAGTVEGRARVIRDIAHADLEPGDILVTSHTDPSWTPVFISISGLVTEVGGLMTHGAVIAREYGLPSVVGVEDATRLISDGQRIRIQGTEGYVELLPS